jgi:hypothetical protein
LSDLYYQSRIDTHSSSFHTPPTTSSTKHRQKIALKASSQLGSDAVTSMTNVTGTITTKSYKKAGDSKIFDDQNVEEAISKAPVATHALLKVHN